MNRQVSFHTGPWFEVRGLLERVEIEALPPVGRSPEREEILDLTFPYMSLHANGLPPCSSLSIGRSLSRGITTTHLSSIWMILGAIAEETNMAVQFRLGPRADILEGLRSGEVDTLQGMFYSSERDRDFAFAPSHLVSPFVSVTRRAGQFRPTCLFYHHRGGYYGKDVGRRGAAGK